MAKDKKVKTNVMRILDAEHITYTEHTYEVEDGKIDGVSVALKCGEDPDQVFKTLVTEGNDRNFYVFVVPVKQKLDLKACAAAAGVKKQFRTFYDETIILFDTVLVSGGKIGTQVELDPDDLIRITSGTTAAIARDE